MEKRVILLLLLALLTVGCSDNFLSSEDNPIPVEPSRIIFNRYEWQSGPFNEGCAPVGIASISLDGRAFNNILPGSVLLVGAPKSGKMLYFQVHLLFGISLVVSDIDGRNSMEVANFSNPLSLQLQAAALSSDGRTIAYVRSETQIKGGRRVYIESVMLFDIGSGETVELDRYTSFLDGPYESDVKQVVSQLEFSPDGSYLAVDQWGRNALISVYEINSRMLRVRTSIGIGPFLAWASDNQTLFYTKNKGPYVSYFQASDIENQLDYTLMIPSASEIRTLNVLDGTSNLIELAISAVMELDIAPGDSVLVYTGYRQGEKLDPFGCDLLVKNLLDGSDTRNLTDGTGPANRIHPQWSADGNSILFTEYLIYMSLDQPAIFPSSINRISTKTGRNSVIVNNAYGGYWMP